MCQLSPLGSRRMWPNRTMIRQKEIPTAGPVCVGRGLIEASKNHIDTVANVKVVFGVVILGEPRGNDEIRRWNVCTYHGEEQVHKVTPSKESQKVHHDKGSGKPPMNTVSDSSTRMW